MGAISSGVQTLEVSCRPGPRLGHHHAVDFMIEAGTAKDTWNASRSPLRYTPNPLSMLESLETPICTGSQETQRWLRALESKVQEMGWVSKSVETRASTAKAAASHMWISWWFEVRNLGI